MTNQEAFDRVCEHLAAQGEPALSGADNDGVCVYRSESGLKCAVGALIPDGDYSGVFESMALGAIVKRVPALREIEAELLHELQQVHDYDSEQDWPTGLARVAKRWSLNSSIIDTLEWRGGRR